MKTGNIASKSVFKYDEYSHGIDYLTYGLKNKEIVSQFFTDRIFDLDDDNSNFGAIKFYDEVLSIKKYKGNTGYCYSFSCVYNSISIPIFEITEFSSLHSGFCNNQWGVIHFYGAYYRLIELEHFSDGFLKSLITPFLDCPISRLDYRFDFCSYTFFESVPTVNDVLPDIRANKKVRKYENGKGKLQSWGVGNKQNKTIFIRLYNKLDELKGNIKKTYLYSDIDKFKSFFRLEYEFGYKWCAGYTGKDIHDLINKAFSTSGIEAGSFKGNLYKPQIALDLSDKIDRLRYIKMFKSMAKNLKNNGLDPILIIERIGL